MSTLVEKLRQIENEGEEKKLQDLAKLIKSEAERLHHEKVSATISECKKIKSAAEAELKQLESEIKRLKSDKSKAER